tara:strand:+ start:694 stop:870 length:177 start_codon:yes stop_codon:yes gene_type:complete
MSKLTQVVKAKVQNEFTIKETDFLLKLLMRSQFDGVDIEVAYTVINKLSEIHKAKLEN